jgi:predicted CXXCH cytochrome family protein
MQYIVRKLLSAGLVFIASNTHGTGASVSCRECHPSEYDLWASSHHGLAERAVSAQLDRAAFEPARAFKAGSQTNEARMGAGQCQIVTLGFKTNVEAYTAERVIGVEPVRQFLTAAPGGRWQTQEASYDTKSNQWFDVYGDEDRRPGEWGHWTGRGMNWNSMCADCHNTRLRKNYDEATDSYNTTMDETAVGCGACHAGMTEHVAWQNEHRGSKLKDPTLSLPSPIRALAACGSCHARRENITGNFTPGDSFFDHYQLQIPGDSEDWYADGQVHSEDYEFASFLGSKMHERGVTCLDCHNPHSAKPLLSGNDLCMRCHSGGFTNAPIINPIAHSHHLASNNGDQCIGCHMPVTVYMQRHARHDHGFTIPDPLLTKELSIPNACNRCHADKSVEWAINFADQWYGQKMNRPTRERNRWIAAAQRSDKKSQAPLIGILSDRLESPYWRAVAANLLWQWTDDPAVKTVLLRSLQDDHPLVREQAIKSVESRLKDRDGDVPAALQLMLNDPVRNVRVAAAWALRASLDTSSEAGKDLTAMLNFNADQPVGQYHKAMFNLDRGEPAKALDHLRTAELWDPFSPPIRLETADVLSQMGRTNEALRELEVLCRQQPNSADFQFKLGLALAQAHQHEGAVHAFRRVVQLDAAHVQGWYNLGLTLSAAGQIDGALEALDRAAVLAPTDPQFPYARANILLRAHRYQESRVFAQKAAVLDPGFQPAQDLLRKLSH